ncbi:MAG: hypothetical protein ACKVZJ_12090 [Phycisphaerales bacterium]
MPCLIGALALGLPRVAIVLVVIFSDFIGRAYQTPLWPLLGFFFMPLTTLAYAYAINAGGGVTGWYAALVVLAVLMDLGFSPFSFAFKKKRKS